MDKTDLGLEQYYKGDKEWLNFVDHFEEKWNNTDEQIKLLRLLDQREDLAKVIYALTLNNSFSYVRTPIPALKDLTPLQCLQRDDLIKRLKVCLMRSFR